MTLTDVTFAPVISTLNQMGYSFPAYNIQAYFTIYSDPAWYNWKDAVTDADMTEFNNTYASLTDSYAIQAKLEVPAANVAAGETTGQCISVSGIAISCYTATQSGTAATGDLSFTFTSQYADLSSASLPTDGDAISTIAAVSGAPSLAGFSHNYSCPTTSDYMTLAADASGTTSMTCYVFQPLETNSSTASYRFDDQSDTDGTVNFWYHDTTNGLRKTTPTQYAGAVQTTVAAATALAVALLSF